MPPVGLGAGDGRCPHVNTMPAFAHPCQNIGEQRGGTFFVLSLGNLAIKIKNEITQ